MTGTEAMVGIELPFINIQRDRKGRPIYHFVRRYGIRQRLPGAPGSEEYIRAYWAIRAELEQRETPAPPVDRRDYPRGTFGALINDFLASGQFKTKKPRTKGEYRRIAELLQAGHGTKRVAHMKRRHVRQIRDEKAETPGAANNVLRMLKILLNFAVDDDLIEASPAAKMKEFETGEWRSWTDDECSKFEARWKPATMQRRAYALALYTGQRKKDQITRTRAHRTDGGITVVQSKTDQELWIPEHPELTAELARGVAGMEYLLVTPTQGKQFDESYYGGWFADAIEDAGLPDDCVLHGLRKCAARTLAELGLSEEDIKSITGHATSRMIAKYVRAADQKTRAKRAMKTWGNAR